MLIPDRNLLARQIKFLILVFMVALIFSGLTAFPLLLELELADRLLNKFPINNDLSAWIHTVFSGTHESYSRFPFLAYGTDWLAFAHLVMAIAFIGPLKDPVRNIWVIQFGLISCVAIFPLAFIAGTIKGIPFFWQLIDCSFGLVGFALLWIVLQKIRLLERNQVQMESHANITA